MELAKQLFPFSELARYLEFKRARLRPVPAVLSDVDASLLQQDRSTQARQSRKVLLCSRV